VIPAGAPAENARGGVRRVLASRLLNGVGANAYGQAVTLAVQFGTVPMLLSAWGAQTFGLWLVISAVPSYLALADMGFSTAAANDMTLATARGARDETVATFQSVLALNALIALAVVSVASLVICLLPSSVLPQTALVGSGQVRLVWILQTLQVTATLACGVFSGGFQSSGHYALGNVLSSTARLLESVALVVGAMLFHGLAPAAAGMLGVRLAALAGMAGILSSVAPWLHLGFAQARLAHVRRLAGPALAVMALPAATAVSLQGFVVMIGTILSLDAVATFSSVRTLTRGVIQCGAIVNHAIMPEMTRAFGMRDFVRVKRLIDLNLVIVVLITLACFVCLAVLGPWIFAEWTLGRITPDPLLIIGLAAVACLYSFWQSQSNLVLAVNRHSGYSYWFLIVCVATLLAAVVPTKLFGVNGTIVPMLAGECVMLFVVWRTFRKTFGDSTATARFSQDPLKGQEQQCEPRANTDAQIDTGLKTQRWRRRLH